MAQNTTPSRGEAAADSRSASDRPVNGARRLARLRDRLEIGARDGARLIRDRSAIAASTGRAQVERAQDYVAYHARRRPLLVTALAASSGVLVGLLLRTGARRGAAARSAASEASAA